MTRKTYRDPSVMCSVCGQEVKLGEEYETSKQKGKNGRTVYAHTRCTKGEGDDSHDTAGERTGG